MLRFNWYKRIFKKWNVSTIKGMSTVKGSHLNDLFSYPRKNYRRLSVKQREITTICKKDVTKKWLIIYDV